MSLLKEFVQLNEVSDDKQKFIDAWTNDSTLTAEKECSKLISDIIGVSVKLSMKFDNKKRLIVTSNDIAKDMKPKMMKTLIVANFSGSVTEEGYYWMELHYKYTHFGNGGNGSKIAVVFLNADGSIYKSTNDLK